MRSEDTGEISARQARVNEARRLRAVDGLSKRQIAERLGVSTGTLTEWLRGVEAPAWTARPNAKDDLRIRARELRTEALSMPEIAEELGISKSTVSLWVRDIPLDGSAERSIRRREHARTMAAARWDGHRERRDARHDEISAAAGGLVPELSDEEICVRCTHLLVRGYKVEAVASGG